MEQFFKCGNIVNKVIIVICYLGQFLMQEPDPSLIFPSISLFQLASHLFGVMQISIELTMS